MTTQTAHNRSHPLTTTLFDNGDYHLYAQVSSIPEPVGGHCLTIKSRWATAANPTDEQVRFQVCLDTKGVQSLSALLSAVGTGHTQDSREDQP